MSRKFIITYDPDADAISDGYIDGWWEDVLWSGSWDGEVKKKVGNHTPIDRVRVAVKEGEVEPEEVEFRFGEWKISPDKNGRLAEWPKGFCDTAVKLLERLL